MFKWFRWTKANPVHQHSFAATAVLDNPRYSVGDCSCGERHLFRLPYTGGGREDLGSVVVMGGSIANAINVLVEGGVVDRFNTERKS